MLLSANSVGSAEIMRRTNMSKTSVRRWKERFVEERFDGLLCDKTRLPRIPPLGREVPDR